jgi:hypothetical protein
VRDLNYELKKLCDRNRDGSYGTQRRRAYQLSQIANQLQGLGFRYMRATSLKQKHVAALVKLWLKQKLTPGTIKNRMAALRWWAEKVGKRSVIANSNSHYGIAQRQHVATQSKARNVDEAQLSRIKDPYTRFSLQLQREFGLRREESIKFIASYADRGDHLQLKPSWTKGGKARQIPIRTAAQRQLLDEVAAFAGNASLIPADKQYIQQQRVYVRQVMNAGLGRMHGLRHQYAQRRFGEIAGFACPVAGGPARQALTPAQRELDQEARRVISKELGHERPQIVSVYVG